MNSMKKSIPWKQELKKNTRKKYQNANRNAKSESSGQQKHHLTHEQSNWLAVLKR